MRPAPPVRPFHAGGLARWERLTFAVAFALMAVFVAAIAISSGQIRGPQAVGVSSGPGAPGPGPPAGLGSGGTPGAGQGRRAGYPAAAGQPQWDRRLAAALGPVLRGRSGRLAVGVIDRSTGAMAVYGGARRFRTASIVKVDILASLLLRRPPGASPGSTGASLAASMIEASDDSAATRLWELAGAGTGLAVADARLGLRHTVPGPGDYWGLTTTTVGDQLTLLRDLTAAASPLTPAARHYVLGLMRDVEPGQRWGVPAAAGRGTGYAVKDGWLTDGTPPLWIVNSIGVVSRDHQQLLMAVLADDQPTEAAGIAADEAAAVAAARCITARGQLPHAASPRTP
jgi:hypothetical protein